jgi:uncharacterized protein (DUF427 family)
MSNSKKELKMADHISIKKADGTYVVRAGGAVLGETTEALELMETGYEPVIYFPRNSLAMAFLDTSETKTTCPHKGEASYFSIQTKSVLIKDCGWSYETPIAGVKQIKDHLAFDTSKVAVEKL